MNRYKVEIKGMHCNACKELINMEMEENGFSNIKVSLEKNFAEFSSEKDLNNIIENLKTIFTNLKDYSFNKLIKLS